MLERINHNNTRLSIFGYIKKNGKYKMFGSYFGRKVRSSEWFKGHIVRSYAETFSSIIMPAIRSGFIIKSIEEPKPLKSLKKYDAEHYKKLSVIPQALILELAKPG